VLQVSLWVKRNIRQFLFGSCGAEQTQPLLLPSVEHGMVRLNLSTPEEAKQAVGGVLHEFSNWKSELVTVNHGAPVQQPQEG
jgi:hypothetical protein